MPKIVQFWSAFKFSWLKRLITTSSLWPQIILEQISDILDNEISNVDLLQLGASLLKKISKQLKNKFWSQALGTTSEICEGAIFCFPEKLLSCPLCFIIL